MKLKTVNVSEETFELIKKKKLELENKLSSQYADDCLIKITDDSFIRSLLK